MAVVLWFAVTLGLGAFFRFSSSFGDTYGPLAGIVALHSEPSRGTQLQPS